MHAVLIAAAVSFVLYALLHIESRPGLFAAVAINSYIFQTYFGSIGPEIGALVLLTSISKLALAGSGQIRGPEVWLGLWLAFSLLSIIASWHIDMSFYYAASFVLLAASNFLYGRAFGTHPRFISDLIVGSCTAVAICEPGILMTPSRAFARLSGDLTPVGASLMADVPIVGCLSVLLMKKDLSPKLFTVTSGFLVFAMLPISLSLGTRGVFLGASVALVVLLALRLRQGRLSKLMKGSAAFIALVLIAAFVVLQFFPSLGGGVALRAVTRLGANFAAGGGVVADTSALERLQYWREAVDLIEGSPIYGYSLGAFSYLADNAADMYPHNMFLEILVNTGFVGLFLFLAGLLPIWFSALRSAVVNIGDWESAFVLAATTDIFVRMQVSMTITQGKLLFLLLGIIAATNYRQRPIKTTSHAARLATTP